eukprot:1627916-Rhodomonas_salina.1
MVERERRPPGAPAACSTPALGKSTRVTKPAAGRSCRRVAKCKSASAAHRRSLIMAARPQKFSAGGN